MIDKKAEAKVDPRPETTTGSTQYDYFDKTAPNPDEVTTPMTARGTEATQAELNPAFYPANTKPEALQNEAEKNGAEFPGGTQVEAALQAQSEEELDSSDPKVANPPAPGANGETSDMQAKVDELAKAAKADKK